MASFAVQVDVLDSSSCICRVYDWFSFGTVVYRDTSFDSCFVGSIQCQRNVIDRSAVTVLPISSDLRRIRQTDVYIQIYSTSIQLLFCSFQDRFRISFLNALFTAGAVVESLSPIVTNFAIVCVSFNYIYLPESHEEDSGLSSHVRYS